MKMKFLKSSILYLPTPINISVMWNMGSILGMCLLTQIISGILLSMHYDPNTLNAFNSITHIMHDVNYGWLIRLIHMNGASLFFFFMFIHISRGMYYGSYLFTKTWLSGIIIFLMTMGAGFLGYVLPWGQMSYWGATVITNLLSAIPFIGENMVMWMWGGFSVNNATLNRFFTLHFLLPLIITMMILIHLFFLHETGSSNPLGVNSDYYKIPFHYYFTIKDMQGFILVAIILMTMVTLYPYSLGDSDNFMEANPMVTPEHIKPEWYFLFAYTILRSIPNKLGGVIGLVSSILMLASLPFLKFNNVKSSFFYPFNQITFWYFLNLFFLLTWIGGKPIEFPFMNIGQYLTFLYFTYFLINPIFLKIWDNFFKKN